MKISFMFLMVAFLAMGAFLVDVAEAECVAHDGVCQGTHDTQANCCDGTYCHKNNPTWAEGRCYYRQ